MIAWSMLRGLNCPSSENCESEMLSSEEAGGKGRWYWLGPVRNSIWPGKFVSCGRLVLALSFGMTGIGDTDLEQRVGLD